MKIILEAVDLEAIVFNHLVQLGLINDDVDSNFEFNGECILTVEPNTPAQVVEKPKAKAKRKPKVEEPKVGERVVAVEEPKVEDTDTDVAEEVEETTEDALEFNPGKVEDLFEVPASNIVADEVEEVVSANALFA